MPRFLLPNGEKTRSSKRYREELTKITQPIYGALRWEMIAYGPGFAFRTPRGLEVHLSAEDAKDLAVALARPVYAVMIES